MRSFVTSVSGSRSSPDPVRLCAQYASSTHHVSDSATFLRSTISPTFTPSPADVWCKVFRLAPLPPPRSPRSRANPRRHPAVNHDPHAVAGRALSTRRKGSSSGPAKLLKLPKLPSSSSVLVNRCRLPAHLPPAPRSSVRLVVSFASPLLRFSMILLLGFCFVSFVPFRLRR